MKFGSMAIAFLILLWPGPVKPFNYENLCQIYFTVIKSKYGTTPDLDDYLECVRDPGRWRSKFMAELKNASGGGGGGGGAGGAGGGSGGGGTDKAVGQSTPDDTLLKLCQNTVTKADNFANSSYFHFMDMSVIRDGSVSIVSGRADVMNSAGELEPHDFSCDVKANEVIGLRLRRG